MRVELWSIIVLTRSFVSTDVSRCLLISTLVENDGRCGLIFIFAVKIISGYWMFQKKKKNTMCCQIIFQDCSNSFQKFNLSYLLTVTRINSITVNVVIYEEQTHAHTCVRASNRLLA